MGVVTIYKKARTLIRVADRRPTRIGDANYRVRRIFLNPLAVGGGTATHEPWLDGAYRAALRCRQGAFLDVGAHIGQTMFKVLALEQTRQYVGFEPQISSSFILERFIDDNNLSNCMVLPFGLFTENRILEMHRRAREYDCAASVIENFRPSYFYKSHNYVCMRRGDEVVAELNLVSVAVIKIDVEGAELEVMEGLINTIRQNQPFIIFEVLNSYLVTGEKLDDQIVELRAGRIRRIETLLQCAGYEIYNILPGNTFRKVDQIQPAITADLSLTNYIALPTKYRSSFFQSFESQIPQSGSGALLQTRSS